MPTSCVYSALRTLGVVIGCPNGGVVYPIPSDNARGCDTLCSAQLPYWPELLRVTEELRPSGPDGRFVRWRVHHTEGMLVGRVEGHFIEPRALRSMADAPHRGHACW